MLAGVSIEMPKGAFEFQPSHRNLTMGESNLEVPIDKRLVMLIEWTVRTVVAPSKAALSTWKSLGTSAEGRRGDIIALIPC
jgi:hypothetical protein